jgi:hypothetical protein
MKIRPALSRFLLPNHITGGKVCAQADNSLPLWYNGPKMSTNLLLRPAFAEVTGVITAKKEANP